MLNGKRKFTVSGNHEYNKTDSTNSVQSSLSNPVCMSHFCTFSISIHNVRHQYKSWILEMGNVFFWNERHFSWKMNKTNDGGTNWIVKRNIKTKKKYKNELEKTFVIYRTNKRTIFPKNWKKMSFFKWTNDFLEQTF